MTEDYPLTGRQTQNEHESHIVRDLARHFSAGLLQAIGAEKMHEVNELNANEKHADVCHSHDFIDANEVMDDAFREVLGREIRQQVDADCQLWNEAWSLAVTEGFYIASN